MEGMESKGFFIRFEDLEKFRPVLTDQDS